jgi:hypothetical protein
MTNAPKYSIRPARDYQWNSVRRPQGPMRERRMYDRLPDHSGGHAGQHTPHASFTRRLYAGPSPGVKTAALTPMGNELDRKK